LKILLDEDVPQPLTRALGTHDVSTVVSMGWASIKNGELLELIAERGFEVFITGDKRMPTQQHLHDRPFAVLILSAINWPVIRRHIAAIEVAIERAEPGMVSHVECGVFVPKQRQTGGNFSQ
jgi:hypothetical protein